MKIIITIKPNVSSLRNLNVSTMFTQARNLQSNNNVYGFDNRVNTHMMKNIEWGAVAYLSYSIFGKNSEIYINNNSNYITGCGGNSADELATNNCINRYGTVASYPQSTTGNITGIFDMNGGAWEYVMGYTVKASLKYGNSGFTDTTFPDKKYVDLYNSTSNAQFNNRILGDATGEMGPFYYFEDSKGVKSYRSSWYDDYVRIVSNTSPWVSRGESYNCTTGSGIFSFIEDTGISRSFATFRNVIVLEN